MSALRPMLAAALLAVAHTAHAQVVASEAWVRATVPAQTSTGAFMTLRSSAHAKLVSVATPVAKRAEIHASMVHDGVMHMHAQEALELPVGKSVELKPGGYHVMLLGLTQPLKEGESVPLTLTFEGRDRQRTTLEVKAQVRPLATR